jgi:ABC-type transport system involved in multi-copper enzyme maturation permease subunit
MLRIENSKLYHRKLLWVEMAFLVAVVVTLFSVFFALHTTNLPAEDAEVLRLFIVWPTSLLMALDFASAQNFGGMLVVILVSVIVAQEYRWGTLSLWLRQGASRPAVMAAKFVTLLGATTLLVLAPLLFGGVLTAFFTPVVTGSSLDIGQVNFLQVGLSILRTAYTLLPYLSLTFLFAVMTRSVAGSIGVGIGYSLIVEGIASQIMMIIGGIPAKIAMYLPGQMSLSIARLNTGMASALIEIEANGQDAVDLIGLLDPVTAAIGIAVYTAVFLGLAFWIFQKQDLTT